MPERPPRPHPLWNLLALLLCGLAIGWMVGLSASPVIAKVLESLLGIAVTAMAVLAGLSSPGQPEPGDEKKSEAAPEAGSEAKPTSALRKLALKLGKSDPAPAASGLTSVQVSLWPLAVFIAALALAGSLGVHARTSDLLGLNADAFVNYWKTRIDTRDKNLYRLALARTDPGLEALDQADRDREQESLRRDREQRLEAALDLWTANPDPKKNPSALARVQAAATLLSLTPASSPTAEARLSATASHKKDETQAGAVSAVNTAALLSGTVSLPPDCKNFVMDLLLHPTGFEYVSKSKSALPYRVEACQKDKESDIYACAIQSCARQVK